MTTDTRLWTCDICGLTAPWGQQWSWYGSYKQLDETGRPAIVTCSAACRQTPQAQELITLAHHAPRLKRTVRTRHRSDEASALREQIAALTARLEQIEGAR